jgi:hypothetical protein
LRIEEGWRRARGGNGVEKGGAKRPERVGEVYKEARESGRDGLGGCMMVGIGKEKEVFRWFSCHATIRLLHRNCTQLICFSC